MILPGLNPPRCKEIARTHLRTHLRSLVFLDMPIVVFLLECSFIAVGLKQRSDMWLPETVGQLGQASDPEWAAWEVLWEGSKLAAVEVGLEIWLVLGSWKLRQARTQEVHFTDARRRVD